MPQSAVTWPALLIPTNVEFSPENSTRSGGVSAMGNEQITINPAARWRATMDISIRGEEKVLSWRRLRAHGRATTFLVPVFDRYRQRNQNGRKFALLGTASTGGDALNFDLSGWGQDDTVVYATLAEPAAINATQIAVNYAPGIDGLRPGHRFSIGNRMHEVTDTWQVDDGPTQIRFAPWLREAASAGAEINIERPVCLMRLANDNSGDAVLTNRRSGLITLEFTEA
jgi:hypothetical protein